MPPHPTDPLAEASKKWARLSRFGTGPGYDAVHKLDLARISTGSTGLSQQEALASVTAANRGVQPIQNSPHTSITGLPGRFIGDVGKMVQGAAIGATHLLEHPARDIKGAIKAVPKTVQEVTHPTQKGLAGEVQAITGSEIGKFVPGSMVVGDIAKGKKGIQDLLQHPGFVAADVLPYAGKALTALARAGALGEIETGSIAEAASQGKVAKTTLRAASEGLARITNGKIRPQASVQSVLEHLAVTQQASKTALHFHNFVKGVYNTVDDTKQAFDLHVATKDLYQGMSAERQQAFQDIFHQLPEKPNLAHLLTTDEARMAARAYKLQGLVAFHGWLTNSLLEGVPRTWQALQDHIESLPTGLRKSYLSRFVNHDPWTDGPLQYARDGILDANPHLAGMIGEVLPKDIHQLLYKEGGLWDGLLSDSRFKRVTGQTETSKLGRIWTTGTATFKGALFLRPSIILKIGIGGLIQAVGQDMVGSEMFRPGVMSSALQMAKDGDLRVMGGGWKAMGGDQTHGFLAGRTAGRIVQSIRGAQERAVELVSGTQRALVFISQHDKAVNAGLDETQARMAAAEAINKVFVTTGSMTPVEQAIIRQVFPFYGFQKHILDYVSKYPAEHPFRVELLSKVAQQETDLHTTGLPQMFQEMFWLGSPDKAGNVKAIDIRGFNPFKSFANDFTLTGFATSINPALSVLLQHFGVTSQGGPELYPALAVDPQTGQLSTKRPQEGGLLGVMEHFIPQLTTVDEILGFNNRLKALKQSNPSAYHAYLLNSVGIPGVQTVSVPGQTARMSMNLYRVAQQDVAAYLRTGDFGNISGYNILPYQGRWMTPQQLQQFYTAIRTRQGLSKKALVPKLRKTPVTPPPAT